MEIRIRHILAVAAVALLVVGCSAAAAQPKAEQSEDDRLAALRWTERDAIAVVQSKLGERLRACKSQTFGHSEPRSDCDTRQDPVLKAIGRGMFGHAEAAVLLKHGKWSAGREVGWLKWRVEAARGDSWPLVFYVDERTGLVEGVAPPAR